MIARASRPNKKHIGALAAFAALGAVTLRGPLSSGGKYVDLIIGVVVTFGCVLLYGQFRIGVWIDREEGRRRHQHRRPVRGSIARGQQCNLSAGAGLVVDDHVRGRARGQRRARDRSVIGVSRGVARGDHADDERTCAEPAPLVVLSRRRHDSRAFLQLPAGARCA